MERPKTTSFVTTSFNRPRLDPSPASAAASPPQNATPLVSVVIPAYNVARFIRETLDSVFAQTIANYEVIVVNDGSPDTEEFERAIEPYRERLRYLSQENRGASAARNAGLRAARGEWIAFLDADDLWLPAYLDEQLRFIREHNCDLACADAMIFGDSSAAGQTYMEAVMESAPASGEVTFLDLVSSDRSLMTSGVVARRDLILEVGLFDEALRNAQDFDLWLRLARHGARLAYQRQVLLCYRARQGSLSGDAINSHHRELRVFDKIEQSYPLTPAERAAVAPVIRNRRALLEYELGKLHLLPGDFARARESFARASNFGGGWKPKVAGWLTRLAPGMMQALYGRRTKAPMTVNKNLSLRPSSGGAECL
jgi:glycosyltransferase involved in cell wall biosynthesis